jgi:hypothetical protein
MKKAIIYTIILVVLFVVSAYAVNYRNHNKETKTRGSAEVTGEAKPPIDPSEVKVFYRADLQTTEFNHPTIHPIRQSQYTTVGTVTAEFYDTTFFISPDNVQQGALNELLDELKSQAAGIGANGIILGGVRFNEADNPFSRFIPSSYISDYMKAEAIFVSQEVLDEINARTRAMWMEMLSKQDE